MTCGVSAGTGANRFVAQTMLRLLCMSRRQVQLGWRSSWCKTLHCIIQNPQAAYFVERRKSVYDGSDRGGFFILVSHRALQFRREMWKEYSPRKQKAPVFPPRLFSFHTRYGSRVCGAPLHAAPRPG